MIRTLVITGGPCAGKSTTIEHLKDTLGKRYNLVVIPEMATMLLSHGFPLNDKPSPTTSRTPSSPRK